MSNKNDRWLDHTGLNVIRIVIGSYFMAISFGLIRGFDKGALFQGLLSELSGELTGTVVLFILSLGFMSGVFLRPVALTLAMFVLCSSAFENYLLPETQRVSSFWRDLALVCAVLLSYSSLRRREVRKATLLMRRRAAWIKRRGNSVKPRRVRLRAKPGRRPEGTDNERVLRPLIAPTGPIPSAESPAGSGARDTAQGTGNPAAAHDTRPGHLSLVLPDEDDRDNIFSNI